MATQWLEQRTLDRGNRGWNDLADEARAITSLHIVSVHSAVYMSTWLHTSMEVCEQIVFAQWLQHG